MHALVLVVIITMLPSLAAAAAQKVTIAPVQASQDVVAPELVVEVEEAVRAGVMRAAPDFDLRVMSRATFSRSFDEAREQGRTSLLKLPCTSPECDAALARVLGTNLVVSSRLTKVDGRYLLLLKTVRNSDDVVLATAAVDEEAFGKVLERAVVESDKLVRAALVSRASAPRPSSPAPPPEASASETSRDDRIWRASVLWMTNAGSSFQGKYARCEIHSDHLLCTPTGIVFSSQPTKIDFKNVSSIYPEGAIVNVAATTGNHKFWKINVLESSTTATRRQKEAEAAANAQEMQLWFDDLNAAWSAHRRR